MRKNTPVFKVQLLCLLQLDNEPVARMTDAVYIENSYPIYFVCAQLFIPGVTQVSNLVPIG
jgi:hypothetical protein